MDALNLPRYTFKVKTKEQKKYIFDEIRKKFVLLTPEEWVRQNFIRYLIDQKQYSPNLIAVEMGLKLYKIQFRADVVVHDRRGEPSMIIECKAPGVKIHQDHFDQITRYNYELKVKYLLVTNGMEHYGAWVDYQHQTYQFLTEIPKGTIVHGISSVDDQL